MDIKDLLLQNENSLPTLAGNLSASTAAVSALPTLTATSTTYWKFAFSGIAGVAGMLLLSYGKKNNDVQKIIIGLVLTLASFFIF